MADAQPVARSPIAPVRPVAVVGGWEVSTRRTRAGLTATDCTPLAKVLVRAAADGPVARRLNVPPGRAARRDGVLVTGSGPEEWMLYAAPGTATGLAESLRAGAGAEQLSSVLDATHGRALLRLTGEAAADLVAKLCSIDLRDAVTPDGAAFRSSVAKVVADVVRDDRPSAPSYLLGCERSLGGYLFGALLDAGSEFGIETEGFVPPGL
ncbi:MAG: sarcosine oxidase subunit gamma [Actinomycetota bacterium]